MLNSLRDDDHLASMQFHLSIAEVHYKRALYDDECFIRFRVAVPDKVTFELHDFKLVIVHLGDQTHCIVARGQLRELVRKIDLLYFHLLSSLTGKSAALF